MELYTWQERCLSKWKENKFHGIANVITGAGKTAMALEGARRLLQIHPNLNIIIITPTIELMHQWRINIISHCDFLPDSTSIGLYYGQKKDDTHQITIYCIASARYTLARKIVSDIRSHIPVLLIADECHHYGSKENRHIFDYMPYVSKNTAAVYTLGLSATAFNGEYNSVIKEALGHEIYHYCFSEAIDDCIIAPFVIYRIAINFSCEENHKYQKITDILNKTYYDMNRQYPFLSHLSSNDLFSAIKRIAARSGMDSDNPAASYLRLSYRRKEITVLASSRNRCALHLIGSLPHQTRILIYSERIRQAEELYQSLQTIYPSQVGLYHSNMPTDRRKNVIRSFREHFTRILISCHCLDEGLDVPDASVGIILSGASVARQRIQRLGRILRLSPEKKIAILYYLYNCDSSEDSDYLSDETDHPSFNLRYLSAEDTFLHPTYEIAAEEVLNSYKQYTTRVTPSDIPIRDLRETELRRCLEEGLLRSDYLLPYESLLQKQDLAKDTHERNYYLCMQKIREYIIK